MKVLLAIIFRTLINKIKRAFKRNYCFIKIHLYQTVIAATLIKLSQTKIIIKTKYTKD